MRDSRLDRRAFICASDRKRIGERNFLSEKLLEMLTGALRSDHPEERFSYTNLYRDF